MKDIKEENSQTIKKEEPKKKVTLKDVYNFYTPKYSMSKGGRPTTLTEDIIADILVYVSEGVFKKISICKLLGLNILTMDSWFTRGHKDIEKNKDTIFSSLVERWDKAFLTHYLDRKRIINSDIKKGNVSLAMKEIEMYHSENDTGLRKSFSMEQNQQTTTMEVAKNGTVKITKEMKQARLMLNDYLDNYYIDESD